MNDNRPKCDCWDDPCQPFCKYDPPKKEEKKVVSWKLGDPLPLEWYPKEILDEWFIDMQPNPEFDKKVKEITQRYLDKTKPCVTMITTPSNRLIAYDPNKLIVKSELKSIESINDREKGIFGTKVAYRFGTKIYTQEELNKHKLKSDFQKEYEGEENSNE